MPPMKPWQLLRIAVFDETKWLHTMWRSTITKKQFNLTRQATFQYKFFKENEDDCDENK
jgi:hypothetical protein